MTKKSKLPTPFWKNAWDDARPVPIGKVFAAIVIDSDNPEDLFGRLQVYQQFGSRLDAYVLPNQSEPIVGLRFGDNPDQYFSPYITESTADLVGLPWKADAKLTVHVAAIKYSLDEPIEFFACVNTWEADDNYNLYAYDVEHEQALAVYRFDVQVPLDYTEQQIDQYIREGIADFCSADTKQIIIHSRTSRSNLSPALIPWRPTAATKSNAATL